MTIADMRALFRALLEESNTSVLDDATIDLHLQSGAEALNRRAKLVIKDATAFIGVNTAITNNVQEYTLPTDFRKLIFLEVVSTVLNEASIDLFRNNEIQWRAAAAATPTDVAINGRKAILYPKPNATLAFVMRYVAACPAINSGTNLADYFCEEYHRPIVFYAVAEYCEAHPDEPYVLEKSERFMKRFETEAALIAGDEREKDQVG